MKKITPISATEAFMKSFEVSEETYEPVEIINRCFEAIKRESSNGEFKTSVETDMISDRDCAAIKKSLESYGYDVDPIIMGDGQGFSDCYGFDISWSSPQKMIKASIE